MGVVATENLSPGMVLAGDVHDRSGRLLLGAGVELTAKHLHILRTWGIVEVDISGVEDDKIPGSFNDGVDPAAWTAAEAEIRQLFRYTDQEHPAIRELMRICTLRKVSHAVS